MRDSKAGVIFAPLVSVSALLSILLEDLNQNPAGLSQHLTVTNFTEKEILTCFVTEYYGIEFYLFFTLENSPIFFSKSVLSLFVCLFMFSQLLILTKTNSGGVLTNILTLPTTRLQFT